MKYNTTISQLLDEMQLRYENEKNQFKKKIFKRFIEILESYVD